MSESEINVNRPKDYPLFQQRLRAWKPRLTFKDASIFFLVTGVIVIAIGVAVFVCDQNVQEYSKDYTDCMSSSSPDVPCSNISNLYNTSCSCVVPIEIKRDIQVVCGNVSNEDDPCGLLVSLIHHRISKTFIEHLQAPVYFYYGMMNFYQNHRQLVKSYDPKQLLGESNIPSRQCAPLIGKDDKTFYAPCGQMANVIFNDTFQLVRTDNGTAVPWTSRNIALNSDKKRYGRQKNGFNNTVKPPNWPRPIYEKYPNAYMDDEELMVWMRPAPLPRFRKLHRILENGLSAGNYSIRVDYNYPVKAFGGSKHFTITNLSWIGGKNAALGILYLVTGCVEIFIGLVLIVLFIKLPFTQVKDNSMVLTSKL